jgi:hypothetical protein
VLEFDMLAPHPVRVRMPGTSYKDWIAFSRWMHERAHIVLGLDSETNTVNPWALGYACRLIQISDGVDAWLINPDIEPLITSRVIRAHPRFVGHFTAKAEVPFIERHLPGTIRIGELEPHIVDYQVSQAIQDPRTLLPKKDGIDPRLQHLKGLKDTYKRRVSSCLADAATALYAWFKDNAPVGHRTPTKSKTWGYANVPLTQPEFMIYSAMDAVAVKVLYDEAEADLRRRGLWEEAERKFLLQWDFDNMVWRGNPVDPPYVRWVAAQLDATVAREAAWLAPYGIPPSAQGQSIHEAFTRLGIEPLRWNKGKNGKPDTPSWDKFALIDIVDAAAAAPLGTHLYQLGAAELAEHILTIRKAGKFRTNYVQPMLDALERDCRVHPQFRAIGTITHRNAAQEPPVQQMPKSDKSIRAAFGGLPGWVWVTCDLEQGEPRTMAGLSGDPKYVAAVMSGDVNNAAARDIFGDTYDPAFGKTPGTHHFLKRQMAKIGILSVCYGVGVDKLAKSFKITKQAAAEFRATVRRQYRVMFGEADRHGYDETVKLPSGREIILWDRKIVMPDGRIVTSAKPSRKWLNYRTQGAQADWVMAAWLMRLRHKWSWALGIMMHDEIGLYVPEAYAEEAMHDLQEALSGWIGHGVYMSATPEINGRTWAEQPTAFDPSVVDRVSLDDEELAA